MAGLTHYRVVVMGSGGVGKSSLITQFIKADFGGPYFPTIENTYRHSVLMPDGESHNVEIVDTAGLHIIPSMRQLSIKSGKAFVLVYDVTNILSFLNALDLADDITQAKRAKRPPPMILVGNKSDLRDRREVSAEEGQGEAAKRGCAFMETVAKDNEGVKAMFMELLLRIFPVKGQPANSSKKKKKSFKLKSSKSKEVLSKDSYSAVPQAGPTGAEPPGPSKDVNEKIIKENIKKEELEKEEDGEKKEKKAKRGSQCSIM